MKGVFVMYVKPIMDGIHTFVTETDKRVKRIHISHDDMDGYGCNIILECALRLLNTASESPITHVNISKPTDFEDTVGNLINTMIQQGFDIEHEMIAILATDLGSIDPDFFTDVIMDHFGVSLYYVVLDHHTPIYQNREPTSTISVDDITRPNGWYFVYPGLCSTFALNDIVCRLYSAYTEHKLLAIDDQRNSKLMSAVLTEFADSVNRYDTGIWGEWVDHGLTPKKIEEIPDEIKLNMIFSYMNEYGIDPTDEFTDFLFKFGIDADLRDKYSQMVYDQYNQMAEAFYMFDGKLTKADTYDLFINAAGINIHIPLVAMYYLDEDETQDVEKFFSIFSRSILENDKNIGFLMYINKRKGTVGLRSATDAVNVAAIAKVNGGGGHPRAAGFPILT